MMTFAFNSARATSKLEKIEDALYERVAGASECLLQGLDILERFAKPKTFKYYGATLLAFERRVSDRYAPERWIAMEEQIPVQEMARWQILGTIDNRVVNVVVQNTFYTFKENRSGNWEFRLNGKRHVRPEDGGFTIDDIWQDSETWENFLGDAPQNGLHVFKNGMEITR